MYPLAVAPRFINTPTVMEVYEAENKQPNLNVPDEEVEELSKEYDKVDGNEAYYQFLFKHISVNNCADSRTGTEGFVSWVKESVVKFIQTVKNFFKWIFAFFTSKSQINERKAEDLEEQLKTNGVKEGEIKYPQTHRTAYFKEGKTPNNIEWIKTSISDLDKAIAKGEGFISQTKEFVKTVTDDKGSLGNHVTTNASKLNNIFKETKLVGLYIVATDNGVVKITRNNKIISSAVKDSTFKVTQSQVETCLTAAIKAQEKIAGFQKKVSELESSLISELNTFVSIKEENATADLKKVYAEVKSSIGNAMRTIKELETAYHEVMGAVLSTLGAGIKPKA